MRQSDAPQTQPKERCHVTLTFNGALTDAEIQDLRLATEATDAFRVPQVVKAAYVRERKLRFTQSSRPDVGRLLSVLAATVHSCGRVLELGTGAGVGLAWIVHGLGQRNDITVVSVERDHERAAVVQDAGWPRWVSIMVGDEAELLETLGSFDLIFADTPSSKLDNLPATIAALHPGGLLLVDDMDPPSPENPQGLARIAAVRHQLLRDPHLFCAELSLSVGVILAARQRL